MITRQATAEDADTICRIIQTGFNVDTPKDAIYLYHKERQNGHRWIVGSRFIHDTIEGFVTWLPHGLPKHGLVELYRIALSPDARGTGLGDTLMNALISDATQEYNIHGHPLRKIFLYTGDGERHARARRFYERNGFVHEATLKNHYYPGRGERIYSKFINTPELQTP